MKGRNRSRESESGKIQASKEKERCLGPERLWFSPLSPECSERCLKRCPSLSSDLGAFAALCESDPFAEPQRTHLWKGALGPMVSPVTRNRSEVFTS